MNTFFRRTARGYLAIFKGIVALAVALVTLATVSAVITLPLWFLATTTPGLFTLLTAAAGGIFAAVWLYRKVSRRGPHSASWAPAVAWGGCGVVIIAGLIVGSPIAVVAGLLIGSLVLARRLAT
ncbi:MAG: hypothetical protein MI724_05330 [Spirochaetales bacterium]|nr:hypothetical protein [Spirochaetales bacterium]